MLQGILIKESLRDEAILDCITPVSVELRTVEDKPRYWTVIHFETADLKFPKKLSLVLHRNWYCDMTYNNAIKVLVFPKKVMQYTIGNEAEKSTVLAYCRKLRIPPDKLNWQE